MAHLDELLLEVFCGVGQLLPAPGVFGAERLEVRVEQLEDVFEERNLCFDLRPLEVELVELVHGFLEAEEVFWLLAQLFVDLVELVVDVVELRHRVRLDLVEQVLQRVLAQQRDVLLYLRAVDVDADAVRARLLVLYLVLHLLDLLDLLLVGARLHVLQKLLEVLFLCFTPDSLEVLSLPRTDLVVHALGLLRKSRVNV